MHVWRYPEFLCVAAFVSANIMSDITIAMNCYIPCCYLCRTCKKSDANDPSQAPRSSSTGYTVLWMKEPDLEIPYTMKNEDNY